MGVILAAAAAELLLLVFMIADRSMIRRSPPVAFALSALWCVCLQHQVKKRFDPSSSR